MCSISDLAKISNDTTWFRQTCYDNFIKAGIFKQLNIKSGVKEYFLISASEIFHVSKESSHKCKCIFFHHSVECAVFQNLQKFYIISHDFMDQIGQ
jgi:hypothetical protein